MTNVHNSELDHYNHPPHFLQSTAFSFLPSFNHFPSIFPRISGGAAPDKDIHSSVSEQLQKNWAKLRWKVSQRLDCSGWGGLELTVQMNTLYLVTLICLLWSSSSPLYTHTRPHTPHPHPHMPTCPHVYPPYRK